VDAPVGLVGMDGLLIERQVSDFLARLVSGDAAAALRLYVADAARPAAESVILPALGPGPRLASATLLEAQPADSGSYAVRTLLTWEDGRSREMEMVLERETGLWRITSVTLDPPQAATPQPTPAKPAAGRRSTAVPEMAGRLAFQVSSGGDI
jgi:hypothetical protein